jgi:hypothetical protein
MASEELGQPGIADRRPGCGRKLNRLRCRGRPTMPIHRMPSYPGSPVAAIVGTSSSPPVPRPSPEGAGAFALEDRAFDPDEHCRRRGVHSLEPISCGSCWTGYSPD